MATAWTKKMIKLALINTKGNTQPRVAMDRGVISEYQEQMEEGVEFPRPRIYHDGKDYWLADGFHRVGAALKSGMLEIECDLSAGGRREAQLYAAGANHDHGLRRKPEDRKKAALTLLTDPEWKEWSDRQIADHCHVSPTYIGTLRKELKAKGVQQPDTRKKAGGGTIATKKIGSGTTKAAAKKKATAKKEEPVATEPEAEAVATAPAPAPPPSKDMVNAALTKATEDSEVLVLSTYRSLKTVSELLAIPDQMKLPEVGVIITEMRTLARQACDMVWAKAVSGPQKAAVTRTISQIFDWVENGIPMKADPPKEDKPPKKTYEPSADALSALEWWKKNVGLPQKRKTDVEYAKAFDQLHTTDKLSWSDIKEILVGYTVCWQPEGYEVHSPIALRNKTTKGDVMKWEAIWKAYKKHPKYKPLTAAPVCPVCGEKLKRAEAQKSGRLYLAWFCAKHPKESAPVGEKYVPRVLVKK